MPLSSKTMESAFATGLWKAYGPDNTLLKPSQLKMGPHSIDVTLAKTVLVPFRPNDATLDPLKADSLRAMKHDIRRPLGFAINPGEFILACVQQRFEADLKVEGMHYCLRYDGRSTVGRIGLFTHVTAGYGDYGFDGFLTLELYNGAPYPIQLHEGMRIGQVSFEPIIGECDPYQGAYKQHECKPAMPVLGPMRFF